jgi:hypothetical protein
VACVRALQSLRRRGLETDHPAAVRWTEAGMLRGPDTWRCGACMDEGRWGVSHLIDSAATFSDSRCLAKSATYSVLVRFHANGAPPEPRFLHGRPPPGARTSAKSRTRSWSPTCSVGSSPGHDVGKIRTANCSVCLTVLR